MKNVENIFWYSKRSSARDTSIFWNQSQKNMKKSKSTQKYIDKSPMVENINFIYYKKNSPRIHFQGKSKNCILYFYKIWKMNLP